MKIASWNVNSLRVRLQHVIEWLTQTQVDVLGLQETKMQDQDFPKDEINEAGYDVIFSGQKTYNGVALLARRKTVVQQLGEFHDVVTDLPDLNDPQRRVMIAALGELRIVNLYIPNGSKPDSDKYHYKLDWLDKLTAFLQCDLQKYPKTVVMGDFNIAPEDADVHDPEAWRGEVLVSPKERQAFNHILDLGLVDTYRQFEQKEHEFSWWDYRGMKFRRDHGLRIDLILSSQILVGQLQASWIDRGPRTWERPSDHTPVVAEFTV